MVIKDGHVVDPASGLHEKADILISGDTIKEVYVHSKGEKWEGEGELCINADGMYVMPGFIE